MKGRFLLFLLVLLVRIEVHGAGISGRVARTDGNPLASTRLTLFTSDLSFFREVRSASDGSFRFDEVVPGTYRIGAAAAHFEYKEQPVVVETGDEVIDFALPPETQSGTWTVIGRFDHDTFGGSDSGVLLPDGRIIFCHDTIDPAIFDPVTTSIERPPQSPRTQSCHAARLTQDGKIIYVGGAEIADYGPGTLQVKTLDPRTSTWEVLPDLNGERWYPSLVQLADGDLLVFGGGGKENPIRVRTSEVMNAKTRIWSPAGEIAIGNEVSPTVLLYTGEVLMTHRPPQLWNPITRQWRLAADFVQSNRMPNGDHSDHEIVLLGDGRVVAIGYKPFTPSGSRTMTEVYDPAANRWTLASTSAPLRSRSSILLLPDGQILVLGGYKEEASDPTSTNTWGYVSLADLYDPELDRWRRIAPMSIAREYHAMPLLIPDGRVIVTGGEGQPGNEPPANIIEAFQPPYLFRGVRPAITSLSSTKLKRGGSVQLTFEKTNAPTSIVLIATVATTHFLDAGSERYVDLPFTVRGNVAEAFLPADPSRLPVGFYMLFILVDDIPSVARVVSVDQTSVRRRPVRH